MKCIINKVYEHKASVSLYLSNRKKKFFVHIKVGLSFRMMTKGENVVMMREQLVKLHRTLEQLHRKLEQKYNVLCAVLLAKRLEPSVSWEIEFHCSF